MITATIWIHTEQSDAFRCDCRVSIMDMDAVGHNHEVWSVRLSVKDYGDPQHTMAAALEEALDVLWKDVDEEQQLQLF